MKGIGNSHGNTQNLCEMLGSFCSWSWQFGFLAQAFSFGLVHWCLGAMPKPSIREGMDELLLTVEQAGAFNSFNPSECRKMP